MKASGPQSQLASRQRLLILERLRTPRGARRSPAAWGRHSCAKTEKGTAHEDPVSRLGHQSDSSHSPVSLEGKMLSRTRFSTPMCFKMTQLTFWTGCNVGGRLYSQLIFGSYVCWVKTRDNLQDFGHSTSRLIFRWNQTEEPAQTFIQNDSAYVVWLIS